MYEKHVLEDGRTIMAVPNETCENCMFDGKQCGSLKPVNCNPDFRKDDLSAIFKLHFKSPAEYLAAKEKAK